MTAHPDSVLVAGIGNLFLTDDGFGPAVVHHLADWTPGDDVVMVDYGIRGMHLAYDLLDGYRALVIVDAMPRGGTPGDITVLQIGPDDLGTGDFDAHGMEPVAVLAGLGSLGGELPPTWVVGCEPADVSEGMGLTDEVRDAVPVAADAVRRLVQTTRRIATDEMKENA